MKVLIVKWIGATNTKPARFKIWANNMKSKYYSRDAWLIDNAVKDYCSQYGWTGKFVRGTFNASIDVYAYVREDCTITVK